MDIHFPRCDTRLESRRGHLEAMHASCHRTRCCAGKTRAYCRASTAPSSCGATHKTRGPLLHGRIGVVSPTAFGSAKAGALPNTEYPALPFAACIAEICVFLGIPMSPSVSTGNRDVCVPPKMVAETSVALYKKCAIVFWATRTRLRRYPVRIARAVPQKWHPYVAVPEELWLAMSPLSRQRVGVLVCRSSSAFLVSSIVGRCWHAFIRCQIQSSPLPHLHSSWCVRSFVAVRTDQ